MSTLSQAIEEKRGLPYAQALAELQAETVDVIENIEGKDLRDVVTVLCSGLDHRLQQAPESPLRSALLRAFGSMSINEFGFNLEDPLVKQLLDAGVDAGLVDVNERLWFYGIATKQRPKYPEVTLRHIVAHFEPALVDVGEGEEVEYQGNKVALVVDVELPEVSLVRIEYSESVDGVLWTKWKRLNHIRDVKEAGLYFTDIPRSQVQRKLRWRGESYKVHGSLSGV